MKPGKSTREKLSNQNARERKANEKHVSSFCTLAIGCALWYETDTQYLFEYDKSTVSTLPYFMVPSYNWVHKHARNANSNWYGQKSCANTL